MYFEAKNIFVTYDHVRAVSDITLEMDEGETIALIGANGAGKTSTLRAITGLTGIDSGEIWFDGDRIDGCRPDEIVERGISMVPEGRRVFPYMSVKDNLLMGAFTRTDKVGIRATLEMVLGRFPRLKERYSQPAGTMSGGEQQMLAIGRSLMARPRLLLLDEPSLGMAPKLLQDIARAILSINKDDKVSVILVEQNSRMALRVSHRAYALAMGSVALSGKSSELLNDERIKSLYLGGEV